jgi:hypothetical protein
MKEDQSNLPSSGHSVCEQLDEILLIKVPRGASNLLLEWHGMACSPAPPKKCCSFCNSKALLGQRRLRMDAGLRACSACSFSSVVQVWLGKVGILRAWRRMGELSGQWASGTVNGLVPAGRRTRC